MRIRRHFTVEGHSPYEGIAFRAATSEIRNPDGSVVFRPGRHRSASRVEPGRLRRAGAEIFPQGRRPRDAEARPRGRRAGIPVAASCRRRRSAPARHPPSRCSTGLPAPGPIGAGRAAISTPKTDARAFYDELCHMLAAQKARPTARNGSTPDLHWAYGIDGPSQGHYYVDHLSRRLTKSTSAYEHPQPHACFIQSVKDDLVNEGGIMDLWTREARLFKYGSGTGTQFLHPARRERETVGRRQILRPDELPQDRRPRRRRDQVGRHDAARRQDGDRRCRSSRHRAFHRLEGDRGAEGRRAGRRLQAGREAPERRCMRACINCEGSGDDCFDPEEEPGAAPRGQSRAQGDDPRQLYRAGDFASRARASRRSTSSCRPMTPTGTPKPISRSPARIPTIPCA